jgi:hypothetical protein
LKRGQKLSDVSKAPLSCFTQICSKIKNGEWPLITRSLNQTECGERHIGTAAGAPNSRCRRWCREE